MTLALPGFDLQFLVPGEQAAEGASGDFQHLAVGKILKIEAGRLASLFAGDRHQAGSQRLVEPERQGGQIQQDSLELFDRGVTGQGEGV